MREFHEGDIVQAVRFDDWKAIRRGTYGATELYNVNKDPRETNDVSTTNSKLVKKAIEIMAREHTESADWKIDNR